MQENQSLRGEERSFAESFHEDVLQLEEPLLDTAREVQSYYGSLVPSKRIAFGKSVGKLQFPEGVAGTG